uniref:C2H2-type domain-containing protein n=1 Tax=Ditylenchus dipsaci TaxID=166011 RepID=A0A915DUP4_9BILA
MPATTTSLTESAEQLSFWADQRDQWLSHLLELAEEANVTQEEEASVDGDGEDVESESEADEHFKNRATRKQLVAAFAELEKANVRLSNEMKAIVENVSWAILSGDIQRRGLIYEKKKGILQAAERAAKAFPTPSRKRWRISLEFDYSLVRAFYEGVEIWASANARSRIAETLESSSSTISNSKADVLMEKFLALCEKQLRSLVDDSGFSRPEDRQVMKEGFLTSCGSALGHFFEYTVTSKQFDAGATSFEKNWMELPFLELIENYKLALMTTKPTNTSHILAKTIKGLTFLHFTEASFSRESQRAMVKQIEIVKGSSKNHYYPLSYCDVVEGLKKWKPITLPELQSVAVLTVGTLTGTRMAEMLPSKIAGTTGLRLRHISFRMVEQHLVLEISFPQTKKNNAAIGGHKNCKMITATNTQFCPIVDNKVDDYLFLNVSFDRVHGPTLVENQHMKIHTTRYILKQFSKVLGLPHGLIRPHSFHKEWAHRLAMQHMTTNVCFTKTSIAQAKQQPSSIGITNSANYRKNCLDTWLASRVEKIAKLKQVIGECAEEPDRKLCRVSLDFEEVALTKLRKQSMRATQFVNLVNCLIAEMESKDLEFPNQLTVLLQYTGLANSQVDWQKMKAMYKNVNARNPFYPLVEYESKAKMVECFVEGCSAKLESMLVLKKHMKIHSDSKSIATCAQCNHQWSCGKFSSGTRLLSSILEHCICWHNQSWICFDCSKAVPSPKSLRNLKLLEQCIRQEHKLRPIQYCPVIYKSIEQCGEVKLKELLEKRPLQWKPADVKEFAEWASSLVSPDDPLPTQKFVLHRISGASLFRLIWQDLCQQLQFTVGSAMLFMDLVEALKDENPLQAVLAVKERIEQSEA